jgi:hypothetical protein
MDTASPLLPPPPSPTNRLSSSPATVPITLPAPLHEPSVAARPPPLPMPTSVSTSTVVPTPSSPSSPSSPSTPSSPCHRVHFDQTCVLIPEATEPPTIRLTAKTYAIPTWARLGRPSSYHEPSTITLKLPRSVLLFLSLGKDPPPAHALVPSLGKHKHKPNHCSQRAPLHPCLRHSQSPFPGHSDTVRDAPSGDDNPYPPISPKVTTRRSTTFDNHSSAPVQTVPLRDCCQACLASVEKALQADYSEHFTKAAARRRRMSETDLPSLPRPLLPHNVKVDEAECARSSKGPLAARACGSRSARGKKPASLVSPPAAIEEDENLLFPLPSPRRSPLNGSPYNLSPANGTPPVSSSPNLRPVDAPRPPSPCTLSKALSETAARQQESKTPSPDPLTKRKTTEIRQSRSELSGKALLQMYPDVDALPANLQPRQGSRRSASESSSQSPTRRRHPGLNIIRSTENAILGLGNARW